MSPKYTPEQRAQAFWSRVDMSGDCWPWTGSMAKTYGHFRVGQHIRKAHRVAYELTFGPIPDGYDVCHHCDYPPCCNPAHLFLGTHDDNMRDMQKKGRGATGERSGHVTHPERTPRGDQSGSRKHPEKFPRGEQHSRASLSASQVVEIRARYARGNTSYSALAREYKVGKGAVSGVLTGRTWRHLESRQKPEET